MTKEETKAYMRNWRKSHPDYYSKLREKNRQQYLDYESKDSRFRHTGVRSEIYSQIEGYEQMITDKSGQRWHCHHRLETHDSDDNLRLVCLTADELKALNIYYDRPPCEFIWLSQSDHLKLHHLFDPKTHCLKYYS